MSNFNEVIVTRILDAREGQNPDFKGIVMQQITKREGADNIQSMFLGGSFEEKRSAIQTMKISQIEKFGVEVGKNMCDCLGVNLKLQIVELTQSEYDALEAEEQRGYQVKINPETEAQLSTADGEAIYRRVNVAQADAEDKRVEHVKVPRTQPAQAQKQAVQEQQLTA